LLFAFYPRLKIGVVLLRPIRRRPRAGALLSGIIKEEQLLQRDK